MAAAPPPPNAPPLHAPSRYRPPRSSTTVGILLVLAGVLLLLGEFVRIDLGHYGWPFFLIVPGVALMVFAVASRGFVGEGLAILGSIIAVTGIILLYQNATGHFESWAYAWSLVFPGAVGIGMILYGVFNGRRGNVRAGLRLLAIGVVLFILGVAFFEGVLGLGGYDFGRSAGAIAGVVIIGLGALLLILNVTSRRSRPF
jgi:hypothetical protein